MMDLSIQLNKHMLIHKKLISSDIDSIYESSLLDLSTLLNKWQLLTKA
jgi:hypothetical protein